MILWSLITWIVPRLWRRWGAAAAPAYGGSTLAADRDRERAAADLREHYVRGSLTLDEFSQRAGRVLTARSHRQLRAALSGLSPRAFAAPHPFDLVARGRLAAQAAAHGVALALFTGAYLLFSGVLLLVLAVTLLVHGASASALVAFLVVWLVPTYLLSRIWRRRLVRPHGR